MHKDYLKNFQLNFFNELYTCLKIENHPIIRKTFVKNQVIFLSGEVCDKIGILVEGEAIIENLSKNGKKTTVKTLKRYDIFGEILIFSETEVYPYNIVASENCQILFISKTILLKIFKEDMNVLEKFLYHIAGSYMNLNKYVKLKNQKTLENKLAYYLVYYAGINENQPVCQLKTKTELSEFLGTERQSLIRELNRLTRLGFIEYNRKQILVKNYDYFQNLVE